MSCGKQSRLSRAKHSRRAGVELGPRVITVVPWRQTVITEGILTGRVRSESRNSVELEVQDAKSKSLEWKSAAPILVTNPSLAFSIDSLLFEPAGQNRELEFTVKYQLNRARRFLQLNSAHYGECVTGHRKALGNRWTSKPNWCAPADWSVISNQPAEIKRWCQPEIYSGLGRDDQERLLKFCRSKGYLTCSPVACMNLDSPDPSNRPIQCLSSCRSTQRQWIQLFLDSLPSEWTLRLTERTPPVQFVIPISSYRIDFPTFPALELTGLPNAWHTNRAFFHPNTEWNAPLRVLPSWMSPAGSTRFLRNRQLVDYLLSDQFPHRRHILSIEADYTFYPNDLSASDPRNQWTKVQSDEASQSYLVMRNQLGQVFGRMSVTRTEENKTSQIRLRWSKNFGFGSSDSYADYPSPVSPFTPCQSDDRQILSTTPLPPLAWRNIVSFRLPSSFGRLCYARNDLYQAWQRPRVSEIFYGQCMDLPPTMTPEDRKRRTGDEKSTQSCIAFYRIPTGPDTAVELYIDEYDHSRMMSLLHEWLKRTELDPNASGAYEFQIVPIHFVEPIYTKNERGERMDLVGAIPIEIVALDMITPERIARLPATPETPGSAVQPGVKRPPLPVPRSQGKGFIGLDSIVPASMTMTDRCLTDWRKVIPFLMTMVDQKIISSNVVCPILRTWTDRGTPTVPIELFEPGHSSGVPSRIDPRLWKNIQDCKLPMALVQLSLWFTNDSTGHANLMIVDPVRKQYERFEPHGFAGYDDSFVERFMREEVPKYLPGYTYVPTTAFCPILGPQSRLDPSRGSRCPQGGGFCVMFSALYALLRALNPTQPRARITNYMVREVNEEQLRKFANLIETMVVEQDLVRPLEYRPILTSTCPHKGYLSAFLVDAKSSLVTSLAWNDCGELFVSTTPTDLFAVQASPRVWKILIDSRQASDTKYDKDAVYNTVMRMGMGLVDSQRGPVDKAIEETRKRPVGSGNGTMEQPYHVSTDTMQYELEQGLLRAFPRSLSRTTCPTLPGMSWRPRAPTGPAGEPLLDEKGNPREAADIDSTRQSCRRMAPPPGSIFPAWPILSTMTTADKVNRRQCSPEESLRSTALWNDFPIDVLWDDCGNMYVTEKPLDVADIARTDDFLDEIWDKEIKKTAGMRFGQAVARLLYTPTQPGDVKQYDDAIDATRKRTNDVQEQVQDGSEAFPIRISTERAARMIQRGLGWLWTQNINYCFLQPGMKWEDESCVRSEKPPRIPKTRASQRSTVVIGSLPAVSLLQLDDGTFVYGETPSILKYLSTEPDEGLLLATGLEPGKELDEWVSKSLTILPITPEWQRRLDDLQARRPVTDVRIQRIHNEVFDSFLTNGLIHKADLERQAKQKEAQEALTQSPAPPTPTAARSGGVLSSRILKSYHRHE